jgi:hypothetical protein
MKLQTDSKYKGEEKMKRRHVNEFLHSSFANSGRAAGIGVNYDRYDEESFPGVRPRKNQGNVRVIMPVEFMSEEERAALDGHVIISKLKQ